MHDRPLLTSVEVAEYLGIGLSTFHQLRSRGEGPPGLRVGGSIRWSREGLDEWLAGQREDVGDADTPRRGRRSRREPATA